MLSVIVKGLVYLDWNFLGTAQLKKSLLPAKLFPSPKFKKVILMVVIFYLLLLRFN